MRPDLDWEIQDEYRAEHPSRSTSTGLGRVRRLGTIAGLILALLAVILGARAWLAQRESEEASSVRAIARLEDQAQAAGDYKILLTLQDPAVPPLSNRPVGEAIWDSPLLSGFVAGAAVSSQVTMLGDLARLDQTMTLRRTQTPYEIDASAGTFILPRFYRRTRGGWLRTVPDLSYWGQTRNWSGSRLQVSYYSADEKAVLPLSAALDHWIDRACIDWRCYANADVRYSLGFSPMVAALARATADPPDGRLAETLPTPGAVAIPADATAVDTMARSLVRPMIENLALYLAGGDNRFQDSPVFQELVRREMARLGLDRPQAGPTAQAQQVLQRGGWQPINALRTDTTEPGTDVQLRSFVDAVGQGYDTAGEAKLLRSLAAQQLLDAFLRQQLFANPIAFESAWWSSVAAGGVPPDTAATGQPPGLDGSLPGTLALACNQHIQLYGQRQAAPTRIDLAAAPGLLDLSPDGRWLVVGDHQTFAGMQLWLLDRLTGQRQSLNVSGQPARFDGWSSDGTWLAYSYDRELTWTMLRQVNGGQSREVSGWVQWAPGHTPGDWDFATVDIGGLIELQSLSGRKMSIGLGTLPQWSPNGQLAVLTWSQNGTGNLLTSAQLVDPSTGAVRTVLETSYVTQWMGDQDEIDFTGLAWSPDDRTLAVTAHVRKADRHASLILLLDTATGRVRMLSIHDWFWIGMPAWSPDGQFLAYRFSAKELFPQSQVGVVRTDGTGEWAVMENSGWLPVWSPDSKWLAVDQGPYGLALLSADGHTMRRLSSVCGYPVWR